MTAHLYGVSLVVGATILWSTAGLFVRTIDLDAYTTVAWRSLFACVSLFAFAVVRRGGTAFRFDRSLGRAGLAYIPITALSMLLYVVALKLTTVANVMTIYATVPFFAAGIAYLLMRERVERHVMMASVLAVLGVFIMAGFATRVGDIAGNVVALVMTASFAATVVMARRWPFLDLTIATAFACALCSVVCFSFATSVIPTPHQLVLLFLFSLATQSLSYILLLTGGRNIPSVEAGLITLLDVVLGPLWVWIAFAERPSAGALIGAAFTMTAVFLYLQRQLRRPAQSPTSAY